MLTIKNTKVYNLPDAIVVSGYPTRFGEPEDRSDLTLDDVVVPNRVYNLGSAKQGSGHDNFLSGILVTFDIKYTQYITPELQRYNFIKIVSSQSKMYTLTKVMTEDNCKDYFNKYVDEDVIKNVEIYAYKYNELCEYIHDKDLYFHPTDFRTNIFKSKQEYEDKKYYYFMKTLSNLPLGYEMWMNESTNYLQLKGMYNQRKNHRLKEDWGAFCDWCETLPMFKELIGIK